MRVYLCLKRNTTSKHRPPHPFAAMAVREVLDVEFDRLIINGILTKVEQSEWVATIVVARQANGKIRLRADSSTGLNDALEDDGYSISNIRKR